VTEAGANIIAAGEELPHHPDQGPPDPGTGRAGDAGAESGHGMRDSENARTTPRTDTPSRRRGIATGIRQARFRGNVFVLTARNRLAGLDIGPRTTAPD